MANHAFVKSRLKSLKRIQLTIRDPISGIETSLAE